MTVLYDLETEVPDHLCAVFDVPHELATEAEVDEHEDGSFTSELAKEAASVDNEGYFDSKTLEDERERKIREIVQRRGQPVFRRKLLSAYEGCCAITGCDAASALEAAHISPYRGPDSNHVTNGVLLRADIHTLFDLGLLGVDPNSLAVVLDEKLEGTCYQEFDGQKLAIPDDSQLSPNVEALQSRWEQFKAK
jgi:predicted restriction endonuclease